MNIRLEKRAGLEGRVFLTLEPTDYIPRYEKALKEYARTANIPGFRPGQAPKGMIEKMAGESLLAREISDMASETLIKYLEDEKIDIIAQPMTSEEEAPIDSFTKDRSYDFVFDIGLAPEFTFDATRLGSFTEYKMEADTKMVEDELENIRRRHGDVSHPDVSEDNDIIRFKFEELNEQGEKLEDGHEASASILVSYVKNEALKNQLIGLNKEASLVVDPMVDLFNGDEKEMQQSLELTPEKAADLGTAFRVTVEDIFRQQPSEINQELFDKVFPGKCTNEEEFRAAIKADIEAYFERDTRHLIEHEIDHRIFETYPLELPDAFLKRWLIGRYPDTYSSANIEEKFSRESNALRWQLIKEKVVAANDISISEDDLTNAAVSSVASMLGQYGGADRFGYDFVLDLAKKQLQKAEYKRDMAERALSQKVLDVIKEQVNKEVKVLNYEAFMEVVKEHNEKHHHHHDHEHDNDHEHHDHDHEHEHDHDHSHDHQH